MAQSKPQKDERFREVWAAEWAFVVGAALVILALLQSIYRSWPTLDPLATSAQIGIGLLLIVACERLRALRQAAREIVDILRRAQDADARRDDSGAVR
ncbi:MAG TPA: hypothetical protein VNN07_02700 [Candidatus Tectomicrobia bacterium]|nr:hypothetical protein [Candidatus Tectomicrobia bacterium]